MGNWTDNLPTQSDIEFRQLCEEYEEEGNFPPSGGFFRDILKNDFPDKRRGRQGHERNNDFND
jgi:hypothetical protein